MTTAVATTMKGEEESLEATIKFLSYTLCSIAYIREFFGDDAFEPGACFGMSLKKLKRETNTHADRFLDWIELGCQDALKHKYLDTITLGISTDVDRPDNVIESYTISVGYPSSKDHEMINNLRQSIHITLKTAETEQEIKMGGAGKVDFSKQIVKVLRTLCLMMQTLRPLPQKKFVSMQMTYYDELTPTGYEPPGFTSSVFDVNYLFDGKTFRHNFGQVESPHHQVSLKMETAIRYAEEGHDEVTSQVPKAEVVEAKVDEAGVSLSLSQVPEKEAHVPIAVKPQEKPYVKCLCGDSDNDLDMIQCDNCASWQHTPCAGYCTNKDKRIPEEYICYNCQHVGNSKLLKNLQDLAAFRRAISVVYSEGLDSIQWLSRRLTCGVAKASKLIRKLESEGLVSRPNTQGPFLVHKTSQTKDKIRHFFSSDLSVFPELSTYLKKENKRANGKKDTPPLEVKMKHTAAIAPAKRRKSISAEKVSCN